MIFSENSKPEIQEFKELMKKTDALLNKEAQGRELYFQNRTSQLLEKDVCEALKKCAKGTKFDGSIKLISGSHFPDIVAAKFYGVEVKSTIKNHWTSTGSSILESTRIQSVERIFMTFGKLGAPIEFRSKPYEDCLSEITVTHYPRYKIDMNLKKGQTIFDKIGIPYDELRNLENPVETISRYYKSKLKPGESLWWASGEKIDEQSVPMTVKLYSSLPNEDREKILVILYAIFPQIFGKKADKYNKPALYLMTRFGVVNPSFRDMFSSGGQIDFKTESGVIVKMPAAFGKIEKYNELIRETLQDATEESLTENWEVALDGRDRVLQWCELCATEYASTKDSLGYNTAREILYKIMQK